MKTERELDEVLAELGREHRATRAPDSLERVLCAAAGSGKDSSGVPGLRFPWAWAAVLLTLLAVAATYGVIRQPRRSHQQENQQVRSVPPPRFKPGPLDPSSQFTASKSVALKSAPARKARTARTGNRKSSRDRVSWNSLDEFIDLPASEGLPTAKELSVVRMKLRGSDLQQYGLQTPVDARGQIMLAEFVVGEDGLPRAIRIVR